MPHNNLPLFYVANFYLFGLLALISAVSFVTRKSPVSAALWLVGTMFCLSAMYVMLDAPFIGAMQVLVYAGAIMVVFLFVIMLLNLGHPSELADARGLWWKLAAGFVGLALLMMCAEQEDLLRRYRRVWRERHRIPLRILSWPVPGRVWAIDFAQAPCPIEGRFPYLLAVRDLASGLSLLWQPVEHATGANTTAMLASLFAIHGAPLVLKSDNGPAFGEASVQALLHSWKVASLFSPPHWPRYNGSVEAGIGSLKARTEARAARQGHGGIWTWDDVAGAVLEANTRARLSERGPSPNEAWASRPLITASERDRFIMCVDRQRKVTNPEPSSCDGAEHDVWSIRGLAREAIRRALEECGYLSYTRRRIPPPIPGRKADSIP